MGVLGIEPGNAFRDRALVGFVQGKCSTCCIVALETFIKKIGSKEALKDAIRKNEILVDTEQSMVQIMLLGSGRQIVQGFEAKAFHVTDSNSIFISIWFPEYYHV